MSDNNTSHGNTLTEARGYAFLQAACTLNGIDFQPVNGDIHRLILTMPNGDAYYTGVTYRAVAKDGTYRTDADVFNDIDRPMSEIGMPSAVAFVVLSDLEQTIPDVESAEIIITPTKGLPTKDEDDKDSVANEVIYRTKYNGRPTVRFSMCKESKDGTHMPEDVLYRGGLTARTDLKN